MRRSTEGREAEDERDRANACRDEHSSTHLVEVSIRRSANGNPDSARPVRDVDEDLVASCRTHSRSATWPDRPWPFQDTSESLSSSSSKRIVNPAALELTLELVVRRLDVAVEVALDDGRRPLVAIPACRSTSASSGQPLGRSGASTQSGFRARRLESRLQPQVPSLACRRHHPARANSREQRKDRPRSSCTQTGLLSVGERPPYFAMPEGSLKKRSSLAAPKRVSYIALHPMTAGRGVRRGGRGE